MRASPTGIAPSLLTRLPASLSHDRPRFVATRIGIVFSIVLVPMQITPHKLMHQRRHGVDDGNDQQRMRRQFMPLLEIAAYRAVARLVHFRVGKADQVDAGQSASDVDLDRHPRRVDTDQNAARLSNLISSGFSPAPAVTDTPLGRPAARSCPRQCAVASRCRS